MISFVIDNWVEIVTAIVAVEVVATKIVKLTANKYDDAVVAVIDKGLSYFKK